MRRWIILLVVLLVPPWARADGVSELPMATRILVEKSARRMTLFEHDRVLRTYRVALGVEPVGPKQVEELLIQPIPLAVQVSSNGDLQVLTRVLTAVWIG